jgi:hypothetical protein
MPAWVEFDSPATSGAYKGRYSGPYNTGRLYVDGSPIKRVDFQLDGYKFSYNSTPIHENVTPAIPGMLQHNILDKHNILDMGATLRQQATNVQPYTRSIFSVANVTSIPARIEVLVAYSAFQIYSVNCGLANNADGYRITGWAEWHE